MAEYTRINGQLVTVWMAYVFGLLDHDLFVTFGVHVIVRSAIRTYADQERIFRERYVTAGGVNGRRVYDTRWWNGQLWYRISSAGTVAVPGTSNHEIQGDTAAWDIADTGSDAGITVASSERGRWIRWWCAKWGLMDPEGDNFGEGWHFRLRGIFRTPPTNPAPQPPKPKEIKVKHKLSDDGKALRSKHLALKPNGNTWLHTSASAATSKASDVAAGDGENLFVVHVYAEGTPGDAINVVLAWDVPGRTTHSPNFVERVEIGSDGTVATNFPFARAVVKGQKVYARATALGDNKADVKLTRFAVDTLQFVAA